MKFLYQQIGLDVEGESATTILFMIRTIIKGLRDYSDNGPTSINGPGRLRTGIDAEEDPDYATFLTTLNKLAEHRIILFKFSYPNYKGHSRDIIKEISVFVTNRYKLELLMAELMWLLQNEETRSNLPKIDNIIYYNTNTGEMFFNGIHKTLEKRNKKLFDALFLSSPNYVSRKRLLSIARSENKYVNRPKKTVVTEAITNLRKICGVKKEAISLNTNNGGRLISYVYPLEAQLPPPDFITD